MLLLLSLPEKRHALLPPASFSPHLFPISDSVRTSLSLPFLTTRAFALAFFSAVGSAIHLVVAFGSLCGVVSALLLVTDSFRVSDFVSHLPPDLRCSFRLLLAMLLSACCWKSSCLPALSVLLIFTCCWRCSSRGPRTRVALFLLTTGSLAVVSHRWLFGCGSVSASSPASLCGGLRFRGSHLSPSMKPLRDCCFLVGALVPRIGSLQQRILLTIRIGFSFARHFFFVFGRLGTTLACQISSPASLCRLVYIHSHCGQLRSFFLFYCVSCTVALLCLLHGCAASPHVRIQSRLRLRPPVSAFFPAVRLLSLTLTCFVPRGLQALLDSDMCALIDQSSCLVEPSNSPSSQARLLEICNTGPGDCIDASLQLGIKMFWRSSAPLFASVHPSRCSDRSFQGMEPVVLCGGILALYLGVASLLACQRSCTASMKLQ